MGPRATSTLQRADLVELIQKRTAETIVFLDKDSADEILAAPGA